jgi:hypothetical protein
MGTRGRFHPYTRRLRLALSKKIKNGKSLKFARAEGPEKTTQTKGGKLLAFKSRRRCPEVI